MADFDLNNSTTTNFKNTVPNFVVEARSLDVANSNGEETYVYFPEAPMMFGYYTHIPEINSAANNLCTWAVGRGYQVQDPEMKAQLDHITGNGKENFDTIIWNHLLTKLIVKDSFCEVIWNKKKNIILNMINISPERVRVVFKDTRILRYEIWNGSKWVKKNKEDIFHSQNKKIGDSMTGNSQITASLSTIDTLHEALEDERTIKHRDKALGIVYYKTNNTGKIKYANEQIEQAVKNGEMVGMPEDTAKIEPYPSRSSEDRQPWIQYNENRLYQDFGVPRSIASSDGINEVGGKMGHVNFEPIYVKEAKDLENDLWLQLGIKINFTKPPILGGLQSEEAKNTGQIGIQPNDVEASITRE